MILGSLNDLWLCFLDKVSLWSQTWSCTNLPDIDPNYTLHTDLLINFWYFMKLFKYFFQRLQKHEGNDHHKWLPVFKANVKSCVRNCASKFHSPERNAMLYFRPESDRTWRRNGEVFGSILCVLHVTFNWHDVSWNYRIYFKIHV